MLIVQSFTAARNVGGNNADTGICGKGAIHRKGKGEFLVLI